MLRAKWKSILILTAIATLLTAFSECNYKQEKAKWTAQIWAGSSKAAGIVSSRGQVIRCDDRRIEAFGAAKWTDLQKVETEIIAKCDRWKPNDLARAIMRAQNAEAPAGEPESEFDLEEELAVRDQFFDEAEWGRR